MSLLNISQFSSPFHCAAPLPCTLVRWAVDPLGCPQKFSKAPLLVSAQPYFGVSLLPWLDNSGLQSQCGSKHQIDHLQIIGIPSSTVCSASRSLWVIHSWKWRTNPFPACDRLCSVGVGWPLLTMSNFSWKVCLENGVIIISSTKSISSPSAIVGWKNSLVVRKLICLSNSVS